MIKNFTKYNFFLIFCSFSGFFFLLAIYLWSPPSPTYYDVQEPIILLAFVVICIMGMIAATNPRICQNLMQFQHKQNKKINKPSLNGPINSFNRPISSHNRFKSISNIPNINIRFEGHHPDCDQFEKHIIHFNGKKYCPGCTGLFFGALIAVMGCLIYYYVGLPLIYAQTFFWIGAGLVFVSLFSIIFINLENKLKFISNLALVVGSFFIMVGILKTKNNLFMELYFIILIIIWIITRIEVSLYYHESVCINCQKESSCIYEYQYEEL